MTAGTKPSALGILGCVPAGYNTRKMTADKVGRSLSTIKNWEGGQLIQPDAELQAGELVVHLYSDQYIEEVIRPLCAAIKPGPKPRTGGAVAV